MQTSKTLQLQVLKRCTDHRCLQSAAKSTLLIPRLAVATTYDMQFSKNAAAVTAESWQPATVTLGPVLPAKATRLTSADPL